MRVTQTTGRNRNLKDTFIRNLACAALSPGLRTILVFDIPPAALRAAATILKQMLVAVTERDVAEITLGTTESDDDLWGNFIASSGTDLPPVFQQAGLLTGGRPGFAPEVVLIPDLTRLSLAASRACVMLMDAPVAHLERNGQHDHWIPDICWLAGCATTDVGQVSPHLLDRFTLRLQGRTLGSGDRVTAILSFASDRDIVGESFLDPLVDIGADIGPQLREAAKCWPQMTAEALARIFSYAAPPSAVYSSRREIALARLAHASARLDGVPQMTATHVDAAARLISLRPAKTVTEPTPEMPSDRMPSDLESEPEFATPTDESRSVSPLSSQQTASPTLIKEPVYEPDVAEAFPPAPLPATPYPEDEAPVEREAASLRLPLRRYRAIAAACGPVVGVERATNLYDLALVSTILEAAKYQTIRRKHTPRRGKWLLLSPADLRSYRRAPVAEQMLVLLLDYTCLRYCDWQEALLPHLRWAYVERASVCLVQVGVALVSPSSELQARLISAPGILAPRILAALEAKPGQATPLAHGLDLARQMLLKALKHGRGAVQQARLVVITDGRGNIPLAASQARQLVWPVNREGIEDALSIAQALCGFKNVHKILLDPQPQQQTELPVVLADALGATIAPIPPLKAASE